MGIDPNIILGIKQPQFQQRDPLDEVSKVLTLKHLLQQGELGGVQLDEAKRNAEENVQWKALFANGATPTTAQVLGVSPKLGQAYLKTLQDNEMHRVTTDKNRAQTDEIHAKMVGAIFGQPDMDQEKWTQAREIAKSRGLLSPEQLSIIPAEFSPKWQSHLVNGATTAAERAAIERNRTTAANQPFMAGPDGRPVPNEPVQQFQINKATAPVMAGEPGRDRRAADVQSGANYRLGLTQDRTDARTNATLQAGTQSLNTHLGAPDQVTAPQVGGAAPVAMPQPSATPQAFPRISPQAQSGADAQAIQILAQKYLASPQEMARIDQNIAQAQAAISAAPVEMRGVLQRDILGMQMAKQIAAGGNAASVTAPVATSPVPGAPTLDPNMSAIARAQQGNPRGTTTTVADPNNPNGTLIVDPTRYSEDRYRAGDRTGIVGTGPKLTAGGAAEQRLQLGLPQARARVETMEQNLDRLAAAMTELSTDKGLSNITGTIMGRTPNLTNTATTAQAKLNMITSNIFQSSLQAMREASKTGGAVGSVSDKEGDKLQRTIAALDQAQGTASFKNELAKAVEQVRMSKEIIRSAFEDQYAGVQLRGAEPAQGAPTRIRGDDGYNALPKGALYVGPDGVTRRK